MLNKKLTSFIVDDKPLPVSFVETLTVKEGVECDTYAFVGDNSKDLAIVTVLKGFKTPLQKVLSGIKTIEGYIEGSGALTITTSDNESKVYRFSPEKSGKTVEVKVGQTMQWYADGNHNLVFYEVCEPPYKDGRFKDLPER